MKKQFLAPSFEEYSQVMSLNKILINKSYCIHVFFFKSVFPVWETISRVVFETYTQVISLIKILKIRFYCGRMQVLYI